MMMEKLKLYYIANIRMPTEKAHGHQIMKMCETFSGFGVDVELVIPSRNNHIHDDPFLFYKIKRNFKVNKIKSFDFFRIQKYTGKKMSFYLQSLFFWTKLLILNIGKKDIIYTRNPEIVWLFKLKGFKTAYECHDWFSGKKLLAMFFLKKCDYIITTNNFIRQEFLRNNFSDKRVITAPNGVDLHIFDVDISKEDALEIIDIPTDIRLCIREKYILLYTGSLTTMGQDKGISDILAALKILHNGRLVFLAVGGSKKDIDFYKNMAEDLGVEDSSIFFAKTDQYHLALFQKAADILLMPFPKKAHYEYFMTPLKMFEYMVSKRPIIATNLPSIKEVLNKENSFLINPGNSQELASMIDYVLKNKSLAETKFLNAYKDVLNYTWSERVKKILSFIQ